MDQAQQERISNPLMRYDRRPYRAYVAEQVKTIRRLRRLKEEIERQRKEYGPHDRYAES